MFELFVRILELDRHKGVGLFDSNRSSLIQALYLVDDWVIVSMVSNIIIR